MDWKVIVGRVYRAESEKQKRYQEFFQKKQDTNSLSINLSSFILT